MMAKAEKQIKALRSQKGNLKDEISAAQQQISFWKKRVSELSKAKNTIEQKLANILRKKESIEVTDHAIVRYLERIEGRDIEQLKHNIMTEKFLELYGKLGTNGEYPASDKFSVVVRERKIVTVKD